MSSIQEIKRIRGCIVVFASSLALAACGGGGGDGEGNDDPPPPPPPAATFSVIATVTGLTGTGLVLQNNGAGSIAVAQGATTANIATGLASGSAYSVTVQTQPTNQTCTVANGSGTATANVSNITITCGATPNYTVGGTISGLTGTGLTLRLNNQAGASFNAAPAAGAVTFRFDQLLASGDPYSVAIRTQPGNPIQVCSLAAGSGTIGAANISNVAITCVDATAFTVGGTVTGLTGTGLTLELGYPGAPSPSTLAVTANGAFTFIPQLDPPRIFMVAIAAQPTGQTCTITRGKGISAVDITDVTVACTNHPPSALRGTYSLFGPAPLGRYYLNFNSDGSLTTASWENDTDCGPRQGNGVEYGLFTWNQATADFTPISSAVDSNDGCGFFDDETFGDSFAGTLTRSGNSLIIADGGDVFGTATAVDSTPGTLVGGFVPQPSNGNLLVLHADGTFMFAETQIRAPALAGAQERGCYTISGPEITFTIEAACRPDGVAATDLNGAYGFIGLGQTTSAPVPFTIDDANTVTIGGVIFKRTQPN